MLSYHLEKTIIKELGLQPVSTADFYRTVFPAKSLETAGQMKSGKYNAMVVAITAAKTPYALCVHDDLMLLENIRAKRAQMNCVSYIGNEPRVDYARELYAFFVKVNLSPNPQTDNDILCALQGYLEHGFLSQKRPEKVGDKYQWGYSAGSSIEFPKPSFLLVDDSELYFCFVMNRPIPMFDNYQKKLQVICNEISAKINQGLKLQPPQPLPILANRSVVGKNGCCAYRLSEEEPHRVSLDELNRYVAKSKQLHIKYPENYEWNCKPELLEWFMHKVRSNVDNPNLRSRVFVVTAAYAIKSGITSTKELRKKLGELSDILSNRFDADEIRRQIVDAQFSFMYQAYWMRRWTIEYLSQESGIELPRTERNHGTEHKTRAEHYRAINNDRKVEKQVLRWMKGHPGAKKCECAEALGLSPSTVTKWTKKAEQERLLKEANENKPKRSRVAKPTSCPVCGAKLITIHHTPTFNKNTGKYRQRTSMHCSDKSCTHYRKSVTNQYRTIEGLAEGDPALTTLAERKEAWRQGVQHPVRVYRNNKSEALPIVAIEDDIPELPFDDMQF